MHDLPKTGLFYVWPDPSAPGNRIVMGEGLEVSLTPAEWDGLFTAPDEEASRVFFGGRIDPRLRRPPVADVNGCIVI